MIKHHWSDGLFAKQILIPKNHHIVQHKHKYDHLSIAIGHVIVATDKGTEEHKGISCINIEAEMNHEVTALEDTVWFCIHATEETNVDLIDKVLIEECESCQSSAE